MEARSNTPAYFDGSPITLFPNPSPAADQAILVVLDAQGNVVQRGPLPLGTAPIEWAGVSDQGLPFPSGAYQFKLESAANGETLQTDLVETYGRITEARNTNGQTTLIMQGGAEVASTAVTGLRAPI